jgi:hypothetical protein
MQNVDSSMSIVLVGGPLVNVRLEFIHEADFINVILDKRFCRSRASAIPDNTSRIDTGNEKSKRIVPDVVR